MSNLSLRSTQPSIRLETEVLSRSKAVGCEFDHPFASSAQVKNGWNYNTAFSVWSHCVHRDSLILWNSKELGMLGMLGMLALTVEHSYNNYYIIGVYNNDMFRPYMWAIIRLWLHFEAKWGGLEISLYYRVPWSRVYLVGYRFSLFPIATLSCASEGGII